MPLVITEGPDGGGKTTLCKELMKNYPEFVYKHPVPSEGPEGQTEEYMITDMEKDIKKAENGEWILMDRINLFSEIIYGPICREASRITEEHWEYLFQRLIALDPIIIYFRPMDDVLLANLDNDELQMDGVRENIITIANAYDDFFCHLKHTRGIGYIEYDYTKDLNAVELLAELDQQLNTKKIQESINQNEGPAEKSIYQNVGDPYTRLIEEGTELVAELIVQMLKLIHITCKYKRFGPDGFHPEDPKQTPNYKNLLAEMDDVARVMNEVRNLVAFLQVK
jgi:hypothetical protein